MNHSSILVESIQTGSMKSVYTTVDSSKVSEVAHVLQLTHSFSQVGQFEVRILIDSITVSFPLFISYYKSNRQKVNRSK